MRALVVTPDGVEVASHPDPAPAPDGVVVKVEACGICGSDVHMVEHHVPPAGHVLGHEFSGTVVATGREVRGWAEGQPVAVNPVGGCGTCRLCLAGMPFACRARPNLGINAPGAFAEYVAAPANQLTALPEGTPVEIGSRAEPLSVALRAVELADIGPGDDALVFGVGSVGLNVIMALRVAGAGRIVAVGRAPGRRRAALTVGADHVIDASQDDVAEVLTTNGWRFAAAFECAGAPHILGLTLGALLEGGVSVQVALGFQPAPVDIRMVVGHGLRIVGSCAFPPATYARAVDHLVAGRVDPSPLVTERVGLDGAGDALLRLQHPGELVGVLVQPWR